MEKVTAAGVRMDVGASPPAAGEVTQVAATLVASPRGPAAGPPPLAPALATSGSPAAGTVRDPQRTLAASGSPAGGTVRDPQRTLAAGFAG